MTSLIDKLHEMKQLTGKAQTTGLSDEIILAFIDTSQKLAAAINNAYLIFQQYYGDPNVKSQLMGDEGLLIQSLQQGIVNFYDLNSVNPYVPLASAGPWIVTSHGAVLHDSGGYGMLGLGQNASELVNELDTKQTIANVMTASFSQKNMVDALDHEIGSSCNDKQSPYQYLFLNSGSEGLTLASRLSDLNAYHQMKAGADHHGKNCRFLSLKGSFHGRTDRPAQVSDSCQKAYKSSLQSFQNRDNLITIEPNNIEQLVKAFEQAEQDNIFIEAMFMEPVMGEGDPGLNISAEFYKKARELTSKNGSLLIVDSVQAGFRATGYLSIIDYPGFRSLGTPDIEVFSKAINGGQYPLSVIALNKSIQSIFKIGLYGNTMTANPRALDVGCSMLKTMSNELKENIQIKGEEFIAKFKKLQQRFPDIITKVQGTGLLCSLSIAPDKATVVGLDGLERKLRLRGIGVIHGGHNALRFTPHFAISSQEIDLIAEQIDLTLREILPQSSKLNSTQHEIQEEEV